MVVLCAQRAGTTGRTVVVAIPEGASDDLLAETLTSFRVSFVRGPLDDVLARYVAATADLPQDAVVVRLTADNLLPDGDFVERVAARLMQGSKTYFGTWSPIDGLPYGLSAEAFSVGTLRRAAASTSDPDEREHVTAWMIRTLNPVPPDLRAWLGHDLGHLRCTVDHLDDYVKISRVFADVENPATASWTDLCDRLESRDESKSGRVPWKLFGRRIYSTMTLGTAQLGLPYGVANRTGMPTDSEAEAIVIEAISAGVSTVDCARAYGLAERRLGRLMRKGYSSQLSVITKLELDPALLAVGSANTIGAAVDASIFRSCSELGVSRLETLLIHRWEHRHCFDGAIWRRLLQLRDAGFIERLGVSAYSTEAVLQALDDRDVRHIQLPFNLLDWRWKAAGVPDVARARPEVVMHARSSLLQGLLAAAPAAWPRIPGADAARITERLDELTRLLGRESRVDLCLAYVRAQDWLSSVVIGVETRQQLRENVRLFQHAPLTHDECGMVEARLGREKETVLDPSSWS